MKLESLKPNPKNPRKISPKKKEMLLKSLKKFGDLSGFVFNRRTDRLVGGHQRQGVMPKDCQVLVKKKYEKPTKTGTVASGYVAWNGERYAYREIDVDETTELAMNLAANKHGGEFDEGILNDVLVSLQSSGFDMDLTGFEFKELPPVQGKGECDEDEVPEVKEDPKTKRGDIYQLGDHKLLCGDATIPAELKKLMGGTKADMVWTDPPYNVAYEGGTKEALTIQNDEMSDEKFYKFLYDAYSSMLIFTKAGGSIYVAHADLEGINFRKAMIDSGWMLKQCLIWVKQSLVMGRQDYHWKHEPILYGWAPGASHNWYTDRKQTTVLEFNRPFRNAEHPTMKPIELIEYCLKNSCPQNGLVLDLFGGSGSTLIACEKIGRRAALVELDPRYCDVIVARWEKYSGKKAKLLAPAKTSSKKKA